MVIHFVVYKIKTSWIKNKHSGLKILLTIFIRDNSLIECNKFWKCNNKMPNLKLY